MGRLKRHWPISFSRAAAGVPCVTVSASQRPIFFLHLSARPGREKGKRKELLKRSGSWLNTNDSLSLLSSRIMRFPRYFETEPFTDSLHSHPSYERATQLEITKIENLAVITGQHPIKRSRLFIERYHGSTARGSVRGNRWTFAVACERTRIFPLDAIWSSNEWNDVMTKIISIKRERMIRYKNFPCRRKWTHRYTHRPALRCSRIFRCTAPPTITSTAEPPGGGCRRQVKRIPRPRPATRVATVPKTATNLVWNRLAKWRGSSLKHFSGA